MLTNALSAGQLQAKPNSVGYIFEYLSGPSTVAKIALNCKEMRESS